MPALEREDQREHPYCIVQVLPARYPAQNAQSSRRCHRLPATDRFPNETIQGRACSSGVPPERRLQLYVSIMLRVCSKRSHHCCEFSMAIAPRSPGAALRVSIKEH